MPACFDEEELADWRAGRNSVISSPHLQSARASRSPTHKPTLRKIGPWEFAILDQLFQCRLNLRPA
jgi:hypothetical protein